MASIDRKLDLLRRMRRPVRDAAIAAALAASEGSETDALVAEIIALAEDPRSRGLLIEAASIWPRLSLEARRALLPALGSLGLHRVVAGVLEHGGFPSRLAALSLVTDTQPEDDANSTRLLAPIRAAIEALQVPDMDDPEVARLLTRLVWTSGSELRESLDAPLASAARSYERHRCDDLMDALLEVAPHPGPDLARWLREDDEPGHLALRGAVRRLKSSRAGTLCVELLHTAPISGACVARLEALVSPEDRARQMLAAHLLSSRDRSSALSRLTNPVRLLPDPDDVAAMPARARLGYLRWLAALSLKPARLLERLDALSTDTDPRVRLMTARHIAGASPSPESDRVLARLAGDVDPRVATAAAGVLAGARSEHRRDAIVGLIGPLSLSPHAAVRAIAEDIVRTATRGENGRRVWIDASEARRAMGSGRDVARDLRDQIHSRERQQVMDAIDVALRLGLAPRLTNELIDAARSSDAYVAAKAARALAHARDRGAGSELERLVEHKDPRVRADALEALGSLRSDADLARFCAHPTPRVRANAVRALLRAPGRSLEGRAALAEMLADERPDHRRSALWVVQRCGVTPMADRVAEIVRHDANEDVRRRATRCGKRILAEMRRAWTTKASTSGEALR